MERTVSEVEPDLKGNLMGVSKRSCLTSGTIGSAGQWVGGGSRRWGIMRTVGVRKIE